ncbi:frataxin homolog, mitochondrial [Teleopsis dalmanni]|uniref:frataxin homolog, mitochondrial n=1 Tax=Teleopsis dalmanni TaxID=139649 RepID=UPI0018CD70BF|nr:frataxin homolog, mitochondrial [Teleopsis dalmanni]
MASNLLQSNDNRLEIAARNDIYQPQLSSLRKLESMSVRLLKQFGKISRNIRPAFKEHCTRIITISNSANYVHNTTLFLSSNRLLSTTNINLNDAPTIDHVTYEKVCSETLNELCDYFEELTENATNISGSDVSYGDGVLTVRLGNDFGTYVINRQTPNKQIWLSSPTSGPKRYDFVETQSGNSGKWIYKHTGESMHDLLQQEIQNIFKDQKINFLALRYSN